jgi:aspartyl protease family protein
MAFLIIFVGTLIGALMPSGMPVPAEPDRPALRVDELQQSQSPADAAEPGSGTIALDRANDGHFYADARVNGAAVHFLVDTGASGIALSVDDARRAGLAFDSSQAKVVGIGASGEVMGHDVRLSRVELGLKSVSDTPAVILAGGDQSLLGQSFLAQFGSVEIHDNQMLLR